MNITPSLDGMATLSLVLILGSFPVGTPFEHRGFAGKEEPVTLLDNCLPCRDRY
jgi:hypothetical protein